MQHAQGTQRFDQSQLTRIKIEKLPITIDDGHQLLLLRITSSAEPHPQILHRRTHAGVVQIDKMRPTRTPIRPQNIPRVTIAMQPQRVDVASFITLLPAVFHPRQNIQRRAFVGHAQVGWHKIVLQHVAHWRGTKFFDADFRPVLEIRQCTYRMYARNKAPQPAQRLIILELRRAATLTRIERQHEPAVLMQRAAIENQRRHHRQFRLRQFQCKRMLFQNRRTAPALRTVKLGNHALARFEPHLIHAVFITVERREATIATLAGGLYGIEQALRRETRIRCCNRRCNRFVIFLGHQGRLGLESRGYER